jgi:Reverse transcriptase (RNA-dependent DNA polymerase).
MFVANTGVPQGANLAALLFAIYINDIAKTIRSEVLLYADDVKLIKTIRSITDAHSLQRDLDQLCLWCNCNKLQLSTGKCRVVSYTHSKYPIQYNYVIGRDMLTRASVVKDLGLYFDSRLTFQHHIDSMVKNAFKTMGTILRNCNHFSNVDTLKVLYTSIVRPKLEYGSEIWSPHTMKQKIKVESIQRRYVKFMHYKKFGVYLPIGISEKELLRHFGLPLLETRRKFTDICFLSNLFGGSIDSETLLQNVRIYVPRPNTKSTATFYLPKIKKDCFKFAPLNRMCATVNSLGNNLDIFSFSRYKIQQLILCD